MISNQHLPRSRMVLALLATLSVLSSGIPTAFAAEDADSLPPLADVPFFRADDQRSAIHPGPGPRSKPELAWSQEVDAATFPILVGGLLIVADQDGHLIALDARTGDETWRASGEGEFSWAPAASAGIVVAADASSVRAFDVASGTERWHRDIASDGPRIEIADGVVYVGTTDGAVRGLDLETGDDRWSWQGDHTLSVRVDLVADGVVYANPNDGQLLAISTADGSERWRFLSRAPRLAYLMVGDTVFVTNPADENEPVGQIAAIDADTGKVRWRFVPPSGNLVVAGPSKDGLLFVSSKVDGAYALSDDGDSYAIRWHSDVPGISSPFAMVGDTLYAVTEDGSVVAVRVGDGRLLWKTDTGPNFPYGPVVSGGMIFTVGGGTVRAYADADLIARLPERVLASEPSAPAVAALPDPFRVVRSTPLEDLGVTLGPAGAVTMPDAAVSMAVGPDGMLYVIDAASVVTVIDPATGAVARRFGQHGAGDGEFGCYCSIAAAPDGRLYVLEMGNNRIQVLDSDGTYLRQLGSFGEAEGQFVSPLHLSVDASGSVYILEGPNGLISKFDSEGGFIWRVGGPSADPRLAGAYDLAVMHDGTILVTLELGGPALLLDPDDGSIIGSWGDESVGFSAEPVVDPTGDVILFQYGPPRIQGGAPAMRMFDPQGRPLGIRDLNDTPPGPERFYPTPVFTPDGYGYSFAGTSGLVRIETALP
jgi:outer membrane protein assembly factor BamB